MTKVEEIKSLGSTIHVLEYRAPEIESMKEGFGISYNLIRRTL